LETGVERAEFGLLTRGGFLAEIGLGLEEEIRREDTGVDEHADALVEALRAELVVAAHEERGLRGARGPVGLRGAVGLRGQRVAVEQPGDFDIAARGGFGGAGAVGAEPAQEGHDDLQIQLRRTKRGRGRRIVAGHADLDGGLHDHAVAEFARAGDGVGRGVTGRDRVATERVDGGAALFDARDGGGGEPIEFAGGLRAHAFAAINLGLLHAHGGILRERLADGRLQREPGGGRGGGISREHERGRGNKGEQADAGSSGSLQGGKW
jgi:hypothetical protein